MRDVQRLLSNVPVVSDDNHDAREASLVEVRQCIANRWNNIVELKGKVPKNHYLIMVERMKEDMSRLLELQGAEVPFSPEPPQNLLEWQGEVPIQGGSADHVVSGSAKSDTSGSSSTVMLPHTFKFLRVNAAGNAWTNVQAGNGETWTG